MDIAKLIESQVSMEKWSSMNDHICRTTKSTNCAIRYQQFPSLSNSRNDLGHHISISHPTVNCEQQSQWESPSTLSHAQSQERKVLVVPQRNMWIHWGGSDLMRCWQVGLYIRYNSIVAPYESVWKPSNNSRISRKKRYNLWADIANK